MRDVALMTAENMQFYATIQEAKDASLTLYNNFTDNFIKIMFQT